jgi:chromosomal replication initiation ATPase DnaA
VTITEAMQDAAARHGVDLETITGPCKQSEIVAARWEGWAKAYAAGHAFAAIARATGRDHTSVMHGVRRFNERKER